MIYTITLAVFLIAYSNFIFYKSIKYTTKTVKTIKDYFNFDEKSFFYVNIVMVIISLLIILIESAIQSA